MIILLTEE